MTTAIDFKLLPVTTPSLCIPRVFSNIDEKRIRRIFAELNIGEIDRIDIVNKTTEKGEKFNRVFVHFKRWLATQEANMVREKLLNGKEIKIIYDEPWFWKVSAYREASQPDRKPRLPLPEKKKATIHFDEEDVVARPFSLQNSSRQAQHDLSRYKPVTERQEPAQKRHDTGPLRPTHTPHQNALPMPELKRGVAETMYVPPKSPSSSRPRRSINIDIGTVEEHSALPISGPITTTNEKQKRGKSVAKNVTKQVFIKKEHKSLEIEDDDDGELLEIVHRPEEGEVEEL